MLNDDYFRIVEKQGFSPQGLDGVLTGKYLGCIFHGAISEQDCKKISTKFWHSPQRRYRPEVAPVDFLGVCHCLKPLEEYLDELTVCQSELLNLFAETQNSYPNLVNQLAQYFSQQGKSLRVAQHEGRSVGPFIVRSWKETGEFALKPHEDMAQLYDPAQRKFEAQQVRDHRILSLNLCLENEGDGGGLRIWDFRPDGKTRKKLGVRVLGFPYPASHLQQFRHLDLPINQGDVYVINSHYVHAVKGQSQIGAKRTVLSSFMGHKNCSEILMWT